MAARSTPEPAASLASPGAIPAQPGERDADAGLPADAVAVGRVQGAWGVRGWIRVAPFNDPRESLLTDLRRWWLRGPRGVRGLQIESARRHGEAILAKAAGVDDRDAAAALDQSEVLVRRADFPEAAEDEYYWVDLIGCIVRNPAGETLGVVTAIDDHAAHPVLRLRDVDSADAGSRGERREERPAERPGERLIPLVPAYILKIDVAARTILADWSRDY